MAVTMQKCKNYALCENECDEIILGYYEGNCSECEMNGVPIPEFRENTSKDKCPVCFEIPPMFIKFPPCTHYFCAACSRRLIFRDETRHEVSRVRYGCPPCPNGCQNPELGPQCRCEEYDDVIKIWERDYPDNFAMYSAEERYQFDHFQDETIGRCPICRKLLGFNDEAHW